MHSLLCYNIFVSAQKVRHSSKYIILFLLLEHHKTTLKTPLLLIWINFNLDMDK